MKTEWKFSFIKQMNQWRREAQRLLHEDTRYPEGWSFSAADPARALAAFPCLSLKAGWKLLTFQFMQAGDGNSITLAVPEEADAEQAGKWLAVLRDAGHHPLIYQNNGCSLLPEVKRHFMEAIVGDGSTDSFAQASLLQREIGAIGGFWHGAGWGTCEILQKGWVRDIHPDWELIDGCQLPVNSTPLVFIEENIAHCRFYIQDDEGGRSISLCEDVYFGGSMHPKSVISLIATSKKGGWFP